MKDSYQKKQTPKSRQRLGGGGGGLSLPAFVNAKSKPRFNPADVRKRREQYQNAKRLQKYKKLVKHFSHQEQKISAEESIIGSDTARNTTDIPASDRAPSQPRTTLNFANKEKHLSGKRRNVLEDLRHEFMKKKQEEERLRAEKLEAVKAKEEARKNAMQSRKDLKAKMFKRTSSGQPLMKHRLQHILESIQQHQ